MNYVRIGEKIRGYRKAKNLSQENLAERVGISVTHLSHIETGNTKLSLPVFVAIAQALEIQTDDLLNDHPSGRAVALGELSAVLDSCSTVQVRVLTDLVKDTKKILEKHKI